MGRPAAQPARRTRRGRRRPDARSHQLHRQRNRRPSALTPVSQFVSDIKALKTDPGQPDPGRRHRRAGRAVHRRLGARRRAARTPQPGELWPEVEHSCGAAGGDDVNPEATQNPTDGSFGDPGVRIAQFVNAFPNSVLGSICDASYATSMTAIATKLGQLIAKP